MRVYNLLSIPVSPPALNETLSTSMIENSPSSLMVSTSTSTPASHQTAPETPPELLKVGILGADFDLPVFDGTSPNPADHLIDVDTPSMETFPDVRIYFWLVGMVVENQKSEPSERPDDPVGRQNYNADLVRKGREYLKAARARGDGIWLSPIRDILANNQPGNKWYRLPTVGIIADIADHESEASALDGEGYLTNIRVPILWAESYRKGVKSGTAGWDQSIAERYTTACNPTYAITSGDEFDDMIFNLMFFSAGKAVDPESACFRPTAERLLRQGWPNLRRPYFRCEHGWDHPMFTDFPNNTMDQFLMR